VAEGDIAGKASSHVLRLRKSVGLNSGKEGRAWSDDSLFKISVAYVLA
jgi:hypothetical protein